jgi:hypothetical protein
MADASTALRTEIRMNDFPFHVQPAQAEEKWLRGKKTESKT